MARENAHSLCSTALPFCSKQAFYTLGMNHHYVIRLICTDCIMNNSVFPQILRCTFHNLIHPASEFFLITVLKSNHDMLAFVSSYANLIRAIHLFITSIELVQLYVLCQSRAEKIVKFF